MVKHDPFSMATPSAWHVTGAQAAGRRSWTATGAQGTTGDGRPQARRFSAASRPRGPPPVGLLVTGA